MSEIKKLIERLCPDGVEYKKLGEICEINRGVRVVRKDLSDEGLYPVFQNSLTPLGYYDKSNYPAGTTFIISAGAAGQIGYSDVDFWAADDCVCLKCPKELSSRYLYHLILHQNNYFLSRVRKASVPRLSRVAIDNFEIPVPPIEVQSKIVEILDNFTELEADLEAELQAELEARRKQYEYYRNQLLSFENGEGQNEVKWMALGEIGTLTRGKRFVRTDIVDAGVPCIHYGDMYTYYGLKADKAKTHLTPEKASKMRFANKNDVVIVGAGENKIDIGIGVAWLGEENVAVHDACYIFKSELYPLYVSHFLRTSIYHDQIFPLVSEGKICSISAQSIGRAKIPVPPMEEQKRIASILDRFETLTTDLQSGLPAEIAARRKQYEYYREKLLTFKRKTA